MTEEPSRGQATWVSGDPRCDVVRHLPGRGADGRARHGAAERAPCPGTPPDPARGWAPPAQFAV